MRFIYGLAGLLILYSCNSNEKKASLLQAPLIAGISRDTLRLVEEGPPGFTLDYFPANAISAAGIRRCEITEAHEGGQWISRVVYFDSSGNITSERNDRFSLWPEGSSASRLLYQYDARGRLVTRKGKKIEPTEDSVSTSWIYDGKGLLTSTKAYEYSRRLKPGADPHLASPGDYEKNRTWNPGIDQYYYRQADSIIVINGYKEKTLSRETRHPLFDSTGRLKAILKYRDCQLHWTVSYLYEGNTIEEEIVNVSEERGSRRWTQRSKTLLDSSRRPVEKTWLNDDGTERIKMTITYNADNTIGEIKLGKVIQRVRYYGSSR